MSLQGKNAVVFGGCGGIGFAICQHLLKEGVQKLCVLDVVELSEHNRVLLKDVNEQAEIVYKNCDISKRTILQKTLQEDVVGALGSIDLLVNSSGIATADVLDSVIDVNLTGVINACLFTLDVMSRAKGGRGGVIVNVASIAGLEPIAFLPVYCASKYGVVGFTRSLGVPPIYDETGVKFITVCPGATRTRLFENCRSVSMKVGALKQMFQDYLTRFVAQSPDAVGACVVRAIREGDNGSVWICNEETSTPFTLPASQFL
ncbi:alcohol dehydrogenase 1-like [Anopheles ziemanni]|uniref:alcohol dehydrogenase 1-like n=1 Tax=Anopheles coustani TaxID=139045 RepID=UPI00265B0B68|nr:alcohol dehydrogenase 1-like [Anopheles coustani]XP_058177907.1 alcohol dehydrogenase 1-like [Anopheles ziemanni]